MKLRFGVILRGLGFGLAIPMFLIAAVAHMAAAQTTVDKSIAVVNDGVRSELITYSDLLWQLALEPRVSVDPPSSEDTNSGLQPQYKKSPSTLEAETVRRQGLDAKEIGAGTPALVGPFRTTA